MPDIEEKRGRIRMIDDYSLFKDGEVLEMNRERRESKRQRDEDHGYYD